MSKLENLKTGGDKFKVQGSAHKGYAPIINNNKLATHIFAPVV